MQRKEERAKIRAERRKKELVAIAADALECIIPPADYHVGWSIRYEPRRSRGLKHG